MSLTVYNNCEGLPVLLFTQTSVGSIAQNVVLQPYDTVNLGISSNWIGAVNVGTGCNSDASSCTTGGPQWDGVTPFSRAEFNFGAIAGAVTYDISLIYGFNVGMQIVPNVGSGTCDWFACDFIYQGCPVPGPGGSCFSGCCSSAAACAGGALPAGGGGCIDNAGTGPNTGFYDNKCPNAYAFPDNDGADGWTPKDNVDYTCYNTQVQLNLCMGEISYY